MSMFNSRYLDDGRGYGDNQIGDVASAVEEVSPVNGESHQNLQEQYEGDDSFRPVNERASKVAHVGTRHHLGNEAVRYDSDPYPSGLVVEAL